MLVIFVDMEGQVGVSIIRLGGEMKILFHDLAAVLNGIPMVGYFLVHRYDEAIFFSILFSSCVILSKLQQIIDKGEIK